ncbi:ABC transport system, permease [Corynebacterium humireducens NBRC 106098 = DSM 45392]|uniref:ABC transport system, permease n=1 Tax=Corynebacterium humireducens NBRC 106098 = DSM 45392 TaxID=1223515 RepID=A0A0B5D4Q3_9CORY|nr:FtsX-like permease family protein [Corynebacterium humireducens]AJE33985.1 ABC transport system, permease [Corynebacterium humireducens NBRC 106098 = DSM 45392]
MRKVSLRNIAAHKLRLALTVLAVVLGTAFISGAFMFTNSLDSTFKSAVSSAYDGVDAVVTSGEDQPGISASLRADIASDAKVNDVNVTASQSVVMANEQEEPFQVGGGTSTLSIWYAPDHVVGAQHTIVDGEEPTRADEIALNRLGAENFGISVGDRLLVVDPQDRHEMTVTGIYDQELDARNSLTAYMPEDAYLERYTLEGTTESLIVSAAEGTSDEELVAHLSDTYEGIEVETGDALAEKITEAMSQALSFVNYFLIAFGLVALLVGTFLIANTFSMIVAQRTREFALLRALGAARQQITRSVVFEAFIVGVIGSALGVLVGIGLVAGIKGVMASQGLDLPDSGLGLSTSAMLVPVLLGTLVTIVSAWIPARRAGEVKPVEAMRSSEGSTDQPLMIRTVIGALLMAVGAGAALAGALLDGSSTTTRAVLVGIGAFGVIVGFFFAGPAMSLPIVPTLGRIVGAPFGAIGRLAATNSRRNPRRTAATAFALTLGVALVTAIGMLGDTMKASISDVVENNVSADFVLSGPTNSGFPTPAGTPDAVRDVEGVDRVLTMSTAPVYVDGAASQAMGPHSMTMVIDGDVSEMALTEVTEGTSDLAGTPGVLATTEFAAQQGWELGDTLELTAPGLSPETREIEVVGLFEPNNMIQNMVISQESVDGMLPPGALVVNMVGVNSDGSVSEDQLRSNLEEAIQGLIVVQVMSTEEMAGQAGQAIDMMLNILYALLALAVIIAVLGIVNTLTLGVIERRQEIGMLRAVGSQRRQVRTMITLEAVQIAVFGAVMGILVGLGLGWAFLEVLRDQGLDSLSVPWGQLLWMLAGSGVVGVFAAIWPANRAAKTPPLDAISD